MAQYIFVSASSFGNGHNDNPTYSFSVGPSDGTIYLSGSGGYVNEPTGISKSVLDDPGVYLELSNESLTSVTCSVDSGFNCAGEVKYVSWVIPSSSPTPTPTGTPVATSTVTVNAEEAVSGETQYQVTYAINGFKTTTLTITGNASQESVNLLVTGTPDGTGTVTVTKTSPSAAVAADTDVTPTGTGCTLSPSTTQTVTNGNNLNMQFTVSNFSHGDSIDISISEGGAP